MKIFFYPNAPAFAMALCCLLFSCKGVKQQEDQLYSRHLQRQVKLSIIHTPVPDEKSDLQLIVFNDGQEFERLHIKEIVDSLYKKKAIAPVVIVGVHSGDRLSEYGVGVETGKADHYDSFFNNELYPFVKKKAGVRKFSAVTVAGFGAGAISALDIAWNHADKIAKAGVFSGAFCTIPAAAQDSTAGVMYQKLKLSRKRPPTKFWLYAGVKENAGISNDNATNIAACTAALAQLLDSKKFTAAGDIVFVKGMANSAGAWRAVLPDFLVWAAGE